MPFIIARSAVSGRGTVPHTGRHRGVPSSRCPFFSPLFCLLGLLPLEGGGAKQVSQPGSGVPRCGAPGVQHGHEAAVMLSCLISCLLACFLGWRQQESSLKLEMDSKRGGSLSGEADYLWAGFLAQPRSARLVGAGSLRLSPG